ncbi:MAG: 2-hydroxyglutaryl-CoA dehydratase [Clostridiales bacterium]|nr:2-hydroxyglutaryl-CoA dehydratase [Clostridiales bacterium]
MYWLGIDIGSISTDFVMIDEGREVKESLYLKTKSNPAEAVKKGLNQLSKNYSSGNIKGVGITGSGRNLGNALVGGDVVKNEITAHGRAASFIDPQIRTIIEIGGQDSKIIIMKNGLVRDFAMNTVCAAGTGSFLDRQAARMGVTIEDLSQMALKAEKSILIAGRCAVFAESDIIHKQQMGVKDDQLMAGMCRALALSYLSNVAKGKKIRPKICFQGGVASNLGMRRAFEELLGEEIFVPKEHKIMGALGAALIAKEKCKGKTNFKGFEVGEKETILREEKCHGCSNLCDIIIIETRGMNRGCFGDRCGKYSAWPN